MSIINVYMRNYLKLLKRNSGFTLIELLVVIGILGVLAAALVATIDPFEQLKKADDAKIKNIVVEFEDANVRYFTTHSSFPWNDNGSANATCTGAASAKFTKILSAADMMACLGNATTANSLIGDGELKAAFTTNTNDLAQVEVTWDPANSKTIIVCFAPTSKSQKDAKDTIYKADGTDNTVGGVCPNANAADNICYWCTR
jgi:prepilin-type N-terminal cleavage/methylation domain-containing protein